MKIVKPTTKHHMHAAWLKSELFRMKPSLTSEQIKLIEQPDLNSPQENNERENLIFNVYGRSAILNEIPSSLDWFEAEIESIDVDSIFILPVFDWYLDTGSTFKVANVPKHLSQNRGYRLNNEPPVVVHHHNKIEIMSKLADLKTDDIVIISSNKQSTPLTIIDGTHRASLLVKNGKLVGAKVYFGVGSGLQNCIWSVERRDFAQHLFNLQQLVQARVMW
ncbi:hypothetical protein HYU45_00730 [Candidatus Daviesbacteria bacterium]|nr:hypothetical protein [Candidatus Daviesbacteria bacterium]